MLGRAVYCKTAKFPAPGNRSGRRGCAYQHNIIPRSRSWRGSAVYRHRGRARLRGDRREVEAGRQSGWALTYSGASGSTIISLAIPLRCFAPFPLVTAIIGPLRAFTCSMLFTFFEKTESSGAMNTEGRSGRISAIMPCLSSALGCPSAKR